MIQIESTSTCGQTPRLLFLLEELGEPYELVLRPDSYFIEQDGRPGPRVQDNDLHFHLGLSAFRHVARTRGTLGGAHDASRARIDQWVDEAWFSFGMQVMLLFRAEPDGSQAAMARAAIRRALEDLNVALAGRDFVLGEFTAADCALGVLPRLAGTVDLSDLPNVACYADELAKRPAYGRAQRRLAGVATPEQIVDYWFGEPITSEADLPGKISRWFLAGRDADAEIRGRFGTTVEAALRDELDDWTATPTGTLALILTLDQFTRHIFRGTPQAYAGDAKAQALAASAWESGVTAQLDLPEQQVFALMPFRHAEDAALVETYGALLDEVAATAPPHYAMMFAAGREQAAKFAAVLRRFGRLPHRNADLGRPSTPDEEAFLADFAPMAPAKVARDILAARAESASR